MSVNLPYGKPRTDRVDGRLFLTDDNLDRGILSMMAASRRLEARMRIEAQALGISAPQLSLLLEIRHAPGLDVTELRDRLGGTTPTIARLLGDLDKLGLIERPRQSGDGRRRALALSEKGDEQIGTVLVALRKEMTSVYRNAGEPAVSGALELLQAVANLPPKEAQP